MLVAVNMPMVHISAYSYVVRSTRGMIDRYQITPSGSPETSVLRSRHILPLSFTVDLDFRRFDRYAQGPVRFLGCVRKGWRMFFRSIFYAQLVPVLIKELGHRWVRSAVATLDRIDEQIDVVDSSCIEMSCNVFSPIRHWTQPRQHTRTPASCLCKTCDWAHHAIHAHRVWPGIADMSASLCMIPRFHLTFLQK